ncbi:hypothetical protein RvY_14114 [Ramazzottius varieornatus]|uniref:G-protein coupled receptors family 1 profile domain-containing protein n=1 Tax=Ramazzottius varieornatus TaxID=947166 RepID=A0A1D1VS84_RAMVA|nr:hypothetical protein RvY_14114 [Ramazzottius varieornatus]
MSSTSTTWCAQSLNITSQLNEISTANGTSQQGSWALPSGVAYFALVVGGILNVSLLVTFIRRPTLRNSFGVYLMNLLIIDTILVFAFGPLNLIDKYASTWAIGYKACLFAGHTAFTCENLVIKAHFLIALYRLWAIVFPISYRNHHSTKLAIVLCSTTWLVLNVTNIPVAIVTSVLVPGKINGTLKCDVDTDAMGIWYPITQLFLFDTPICVVLLTYPVVCYKSFFQDRKQRVAPSDMS